VFVSRHHLESAEHIDRIRDKAEVIYNAVALERFASGTSVRESLQLRPQQFVVGIVSQLAKRKGIDLIVEAAVELIPRHPELVFLVAGGTPPVGDQEFPKEVRARANDPVFDGRLRFLGGRSDIPDLLATCDAFLLPSRAEPLGIAIIEAMAAGLPVIASRVGGIPEIINTPSIGTLIEPSVDSIVKAVGDLLTAPDRGRAMGLAGAQSLQGRFDAASVAARWNELYAQLARARTTR
jgi:glycosyltransferase involved in cell wall biosynthesis